MLQCFFIERFSCILRCVMFNSLSGTLTAKSVQKVFIETHGIEWEIFCPQTAVDHLPSVGDAAKVYVWLQHTENAMTLFGFATESERALFFDLMKVDGIGPKGALKIMSNVSPVSLARILEAGDVESLKKIPGVGAKTAGKIILQLKGKLYLEQDSTPQKDTSPFADIAAALVDMGYERRRVQEALKTVCVRLEGQEDFSSLPQRDKEEAVFRSAVLELAQ